MQIFSINPYNYQKPSFEGRGKPIGLKYIVQKRSNLLPERVLTAARQTLQYNSANMPSLKELHLKIYSPLLECNSLEEAKALFPEFENIDGNMTFARNSVYKQNFERQTAGINFPLKMLQEFWVNLKTKDEIAQELGFKNRSSIDWYLKHINFVSYPSNYKTLLKASDENENKIIAEKTKAYNALHPDLMYARNKHAAQFCKTDEYKTAQRERILEYDRIHPERREKISEFDKRTWELCPEIREALSEFSSKEPKYVLSLITKKSSGQPITETQRKTLKNFYKRFWDSHPFLKEVLAAAKERVRQERSK